MPSSWILQGWSAGAKLGFIPDHLGARIHEADAVLSGNDQPKSMRPGIWDHSVTLPRTSRYSIGRRMYDTPKDSRVAFATPLPDQVVNSTTLNWSVTSPSKVAR